MKNVTVSIARLAAVVVALCFLGGYVLYSMGYVELPWVRSRAHRNVLASSKDAVILEASADQGATENNKGKPAITELPGHPKPSQETPASPVLLMGTKSGVPIVRAEREPAQTTPEKGSPVPLVITSKAISQPIFNVQREEKPPTLADSPEGDKHETPANIAKLKDVTRLLKDANEFFNDGNYDLALKRVDQVLNIDRYNAAARRLQEEINRTIAGSSSRISDSRLQLQEEYSLTPGRGDSSEHLITRNTEKLNSIILPSVQFQDATIAECLKYLRQQSVRFDPKGEGLNFVFRTDAEENSFPAEHVIGLEDFGATPAPPPAAASSAPTDFSKKRISLRQTNVPLAVALKFVADLAGLTFRVEEYAVVLQPAGTASTPYLYTRELSVSPEALSRLLDRKVESAANLNHWNAKDTLAAEGVSFDIPGSSVTFLPASMKLVVRHSRQNIDLIESILTGVAVDPTARYIDKLNAIILPSVQFEDATVAECLEYLRQQTARLEPPGERVSNLKLEILTKDGAPASDVSQKRISLHLTNVPSGIALKYITDLAGLEFRVVQTPEEAPADQVKVIEPATK